MGGNGDYKIIFLGPVGAGKTSAVTALSDIAPTRMDHVAAADRGRQQSTILAMDYGLVHLGGVATIHLYGTQGEPAFDAMDDLVAQGIMGLVLLIDNTRPDPLGDLRFFLEGCLRFMSRADAVVGITRTDLRPYPMMEDYYRELETLGIASTPILEVDARSRKDVSLLVEALLCSVDPLAGY